MWDVEGPVYTRFDERVWIPNKIPLSAIVSGACRSLLVTDCVLTAAHRAGPIAGGDFTENVTTLPRAVHKDYFYKICPKRTIISVDDVHKIAVKGTDYDPYKITQTYLEFLNRIDDPCVEIAAKPGHTTFNIE